MMQYQYVVILKKDGDRAVDNLSALLCFGSAVIFLLTQLRSSRLWYYPGAFSILLAGGLIYNLFIRGRRRKPVRYKYLLMLAALGWFGMPGVPWVGILFLGLAFLEHQTKRPLEIGFDPDRVVINTLIRRRHDWSVFNNVLLKDGLLTLDFKNNRLFQKEVIEDDDDDNADEEEFNAWCHERLGSAYGN